MSKRVICILTAIILTVCALPSAAVEDIRSEVYQTYIKNGDMSDFWTVLAASSLGLNVDARTAVKEDASALELASALIMEIASGRDGSELKKRLIECVNESGSIHNEYDTTDEKVGQYATSQAIAIIALEISGAKYDRVSALKYLFSQQCENGGMGFYEYDDVTTSCWAMTAYIMGTYSFDGVGPIGQDKVQALQKYIDSSVRDNVVYEYGEPNMWSSAAYIALLAAQNSEKLEVAYTAFIDKFYKNGLFDTDYQPVQGVLGVGCYFGGNVFLNLRDGNIRTEVFGDMINHPAKAEVYILYSHGVVGGTGASFEPDGAVTRAQAAKMFALTAGMPTKCCMNFYDVSEEAWYAPFVAYCAQNKIVGGYMGFFRPDDNITDSEFRLMCERAGYEVKIELSPVVTRAQAAVVLAGYVK